MAPMVSMRPGPTAARKTALWAACSGNMLSGRFPRTLFARRGIVTGAAVHQDGVEFPSPVPRASLQQRREAIRNAKPFSEFLTDSFDRQHDYLRISITERCNLRCLYCMPEEGVPLSPPAHMLTTPEIFYLSSLFVSQGVTKIRLTGGEPTVRRDIVPLMQSIGTLRPKGLRELALTTNGISLHRKLDAMVEAGLTGVNLSLDTLDPFQFQIMTRRKGFDAVMRSIDRILEMKKLGANLKLKVNCVVMRGLNERDIIPFVEMGREKDIEVRFIEYMPFGGNKWSQGKMISFQEMLDIIRTKYPGLRSVPGHKNDTSKTYEVPGFVGKVGFITSMTNDFCGTCNRLRITSDGNLKVCLHGNDEVSLRDLLRKDNGGAPIDEAAFERIKQTEMDRHNGLLSDETTLGWGDRERELLNVIGVAVKRKAEKHADLGDLEKMENRPMILIDSASTNPTPKAGTPLSQRGLEHTIPNSLVRPWASIPSPRLPFLYPSSTLQPALRRSITTSDRGVGVTKEDERRISRAEHRDSILLRALAERNLNLEETIFEHKDEDLHYEKAQERRVNLRGGKTITNQNRTIMDPGQIEKAKKIVQSKIDSLEAHLQMEKDHPVAEEPPKWEDFRAKSFDNIGRTTVRMAWRKRQQGVRLLRKVARDMRKKQNAEPENIDLAVKKELQNLEKRHQAEIARLEKKVSVFRDHLRQLGEQRSVGGQSIWQAQDLMQEPTRLVSGKREEKEKEAKEAKERHEGKDGMQELEQISKGQRVGQEEQENRNPVQELMQISKGKRVIQQEQVEEKKPVQRYKPVARKGTELQSHLTATSPRKEPRLNLQALKERQDVLLQERSKRVEELRRFKVSEKPAPSTQSPNESTPASGIDEAPTRPEAPEEKREELKDLSQSIALLKEVAEQATSENENTEVLNQIQVLLDEIRNARKKLAKPGASQNASLAKDSSDMTSQEASSVPEDIADAETSDKCTLFGEKNKPDPIPPSWPASKKMLPRSLSDSLRPSFPARGTVEIDAGFTVDFDAPVIELQSQVLEMRNRLRNVFIGFDQMPYEVWTSNNKTTLKTWLRILVGKWTTRFDDKVSLEGDADDEVEKVLQQMVRDHDLSADAAERMAKRWQEIFSDKSKMTNEAHIDWDEFDAQMPWLRDDVGVMDGPKAETYASIARAGATPKNDYVDVHEGSQKWSMSKGLGYKKAKRSKFGIRSYSTSPRAPLPDQVSQKPGSNPPASEEAKETRHPEHAPKATELPTALPHLTPAGSAHMVSVSEKPHTPRTAVAAGRVLFSNPTPASLIRANALKKGDVLSVSRIAGIMAAKQTPVLIPLCHPIALTHVGVELALFDEGAGAGEGAGARHGGVHVEAKVQCTGQTGVEMEALTAVMGAALSVVDMCKAVDKGMTVEGVRVVLKEGGRSGTWKEEGWVSALEK
ncbi:hypothetical protein BS50DRAFT_567365 [Corynespora cassiicola Philippines]|uniref:Radical SAM core domain-containing protein n=1 Tax=Corynespora cassiicola Philippines TaxID=1448308 RepID=A0A2T2PA60_CORCC|nr:hypothetical protein BS50DRAFT_567365 [Corynespora cassiicola Philippines]